jgi:Cell wall-active antibiotics response 4TMS YvqF
VPLAAIAAAGLIVWWFVSGDGLSGNAGALARRAALGILVLAGCAALFVAGVWATGIGSGGVAAGLVIGAGLAVLAGAFFKPVRWVVPVAFSLALGIGVAAATDLDLHGGAGERVYRPATAAELRPDYQLGAGRLVVDLRGAELPRGDVPVRVRVGLGQALVIVPPNACVASKATVGAGATDVLGRDSGGIDVDWEDQPVAAPAQTRIVIDGNVGMGAFQVSYRNDDPGDHWDGDRGDGRDPVARADRAQAAAACAGVGRSA